MRMICLRCGCPCDADGVHRRDKRLRSCADPATPIPADTFDAALRKAINGSP